MTKKTAVKDWRTDMLQRLRAIIMSVPGVTEEIKYRKPTNPAGIPVWYANGMLVTGETYKSHLRFTFAKGNKLKDPKKLLNNFRAMTIQEGDKVNAAAFKALIKEAVKLNAVKK